MLRNQKVHRVYNIELKDKVSDPRIYHVQIYGDSRHDFFVAIATEQNDRPNIFPGGLIQKWCNLNFNELPKDGDTFELDLDEVRLPPQRS